MEERSLIIVIEECGDVVDRLMLNDDQVRLLEWLIGNQWLNLECKNFQIMDKTSTPIIL